MQRYQDAGETLRRSGDVASMFGRQRTFIAWNHVKSSRGLIQCGIGESIC